MAKDVFDIVGTIVGGAFNVETVVAEGGFAVVYRAFHSAFHAPVALKCLKIPTVRRTDQEEFLERFREEGEVLFRLSQSISSVVRPLHVDAFETADGVFVPYMALEWLDGETLDVAIARRRADGLRPMSPKHVVRLLSPVARALQRAHNFPGKTGPVSIVHRDLKPDNIVIATVNNEEVVKILDFGIAKVKSVASQVAGRQSQDSQGGVPFTPGYAAPEQWFPKRYGQSGPWTDVWGLALCAVEAMSGKPAIDGDHAAMMGTAIDERRRPTPGNEGVRVSDAVEEVFHRALCVDPRHRYHEVGVFWDDLEEAFGLPSTRTASGLGTSGVFPIEGPPDLDTHLSAKEGLAAPRAEKPGRPRTPNLQVPDLDLPAESIEPEELDIDLEQASRRAERKAPPPPPSPTSKKTPPKPPPPKLPGVEHGYSGALPLGTPEEPSGLDLAVSPGEVRKSRSQMQAVRPPEPSANRDIAGLQIEKRTSSSTMRAVVPSSEPSILRKNTPPSSKSPRALLQSLRPSQLDSGFTFRRFGIPITMAVVGLVLALAYYINASMGGGRWALGPVPVNWIAGLFVLTGLGVVLVRYFWPEE